MSDAITIRPYRPGDETGLLAGHNRIFPPRTMAHWLWKFRDNPTGLVHTMVADHEQEGLVGAYVTIPARVVMEGETRICGQCVDLWVMPDHRRYGPRPGLFVNLALAHYELWGGRGADQNAFHYGWPIATWRIGQKYLRDEMVRDWDFLFRELPPGGLPPRATSAELEVRRVARYDADTDALWAALAPTFQLAIVRDARYLNWRFADAQDAAYELFECRERRTGRLRGIAVLTQRDFLAPNGCFLVDWLLPADDLDATVALVATAEQRAAALRAPSLATLFQHRDPRFLGFQRLGFLVYGSTYFQVVIPFDQHEALFYKEHWYHTLGDSDLV
ncbi:MAG: GNAT family N-acetyltransferase [Planctomycetes bacterium]|nr:GNAT family N-acetyltransferase [Planctomycetota bacterium]